MEKFRVDVISHTPLPQRCIYFALHQDHSEDYVGENPNVVDLSVWYNANKIADLAQQEEHYGKIAVERLLKGGKGHYGCLEHPHITLACGYLPHSTMYQATRHRFITFDVQSGRYTGDRFIKVVKGELPIEEVIYIRPVGTYVNYDTKKEYYYSPELRKRDLESALVTLKNYADAIERGMSYEHARTLIMFEHRQHWIMTLNIRTLMHFLDLRAKPNAQKEMQVFAARLLDIFHRWTPEIARWYEDTRLHKALLAP